MFHLFINTCMMRMGRGKKMGAGRKDVGRCVNSKAKLLPIRFCSQLQRQINYSSWCLPWVRALHNFTLISHFQGWDETVTHPRTHAWSLILWNYLHACTHIHTLSGQYKQEYVSMSLMLIFYGAKQVATPLVVLRTTLVWEKSRTWETKLEFKGELKCWTPLDRERKLFIYVSKSKKYCRQN